MANIPSEFKYTRDHEWVSCAGETALIGVTDFAQKQLGDVVYVELPNVGDSFEAGEPFGSVESVKAVSEVYAPLAGSVSERNDMLNDSPELLNDDPYGDGWLIRLTTSDPAPEGLMSAEEYEGYISETG